MKRSRRRTGRWALLLGLLLTLPGTAAAQGFQFSPSIGVFITAVDNPLLASGESFGTNGLLVEAQLPFQFRGPRWNGSFTMQPGYQRFRDGSARDAFTGAMEANLESRLSARTTLFVEGELVRSNDLLGQLGVDILLPRESQTRGRIEMRLGTRLSPRDSVSVYADYQHLEFSSHTFVGHESYGLGVGYGHEVGARLTLTASAVGQLVQFRNDVQARSVTTTAGFAYRLAPRTRLEVGGGVLWIQQDAGAGFVNLEGPSWAAQASLAHSLQNVALGILASRDVGFTNGLGRTTLRDQVLATVSAAQGSWNLVGTAGYARNRPLEGAQQATPPIDTWTGCLSAGLQITPYVAATGSFLFAHQIGQADRPLDIDSYRAAAGIVFRLPGPRVPLRPGQRLDARSMARSAHVTC